MYIVYGLVILVHRNIKVIKTMISTSKIDILCNDETKLDTSFPDSQFNIDGYQFPLFRKEGDSKACVKIVSILEDIVGKRLSNCESPSNESICKEQTICKRKSCILLAYQSYSKIFQALSVKL